MTKVQRKRVEKLMAALRSGDYKQYRGALGIVKHNESRYCCLGVACEIVQKVPGMPKRKEKSHDGGMYSGILYGHKDSDLPKTVMDYYGFRHSEGEYKDSEGYTWSLAELNDENKKSFKYIAHVIERELRNPNSTMFV